MGARSGRSASAGFAALQLICRRRILGEKEGRIDPVIRGVLVHEGKLSKFNVQHKVAILDLRIQYAEKAALALLAQAGVMGLIDHIRLQCADLRILVEDLIGSPFDEFRYVGIGARLVDLAHDHCGGIHLLIRGCRTPLHLLHGAEAALHGHRIDHPAGGQARRPQKLRFSGLQIVGVVELSDLQHRHLLGNMSELIEEGSDQPAIVAAGQLQEIDRWALAALDDLIVNTSAGYAVYDFNKVYHAVYNFCVVAMSNFYLDVTKDRLYCTNGAARKAAQTTMYKILVALDKIIAPILCFTSQEIWDFMPKTEGMNKYVVFEDMPKAGQYAADEAFKAKWAQLIAVRDEVKKVLEQARAEKIIGASLEAAVTLYCNDAVYDLLNSIPMDELADLMIVSQVELVKGEGGAASAVEGLGVAAAHATGEKCERCWKYSATIGSHAAHPTLCARCASVVEA